MSVLLVEDMSVVVNVMLPLMSVMSVKSVMSVMSEMVILYTLCHPRDCYL